MYDRSSIMMDGPRCRRRCPEVDKLRVSPETSDQYGGVVVVAGGHPIKDVVQ